MKYALSLMASLVFLLGCKKDSGNTKVAPTNLVVTTTISTDGSGKVDFKATADNAVSYDFEFGTGAVTTATNGLATYTYTLVGTNTFPVIVTAKSSSGLTLKKTVNITVSVRTPNTTLVWSDEFDGSGIPDPTKWVYETGAGGWGNSELQYYTNRLENGMVEGGFLKIKAIKETFSGSPYTSARIITKDKFAFKYGKVEVRAKMPVGVGTWPAIWMLGSNINTVSWPACGEIDIAEHLGRELNKIYGTLHYPGRSGGNANGATKIIANATTEFHKYGLEWSAATIKISVDDEVFHIVANSGSIPFNHDFFFILNIAMGGNFGGPVEAAFSNSTMEIDYIKVYQ